MVGALLIVIPALVYIELFDFSEEPGGLIYIGTFIGILVVEAVILAAYRSRRSAPLAATDRSTTPQ